MSPLSHCPTVTTITKRYFNRDTMRGNLVLFEGLDRTGKSTQAERLAQALGGRLVKFPDRSTPIGQVINRYLTDASYQLSDEAAHLLFSANRWEVAASIEDSLQQGVHVVLDRYVYSGVAYSLAKENLRGQAWLMGPDLGLPKPDQTFFFRLLMAELAARKGWGEERYERTEFQRKVLDAFMEVLPQADSGIDILDVDGLLMDEVTELVWALVTRKSLQKPTDSALQRL